MAQEDQETPTETAALRIAKTLAEINSAGGNAADALGMAEERGWQAIFAGDGGGNTTTALCGQKNGVQG